MRTYTYSEARQQLATLLDQARREGRVLIRRQDGSTFAVEPVVSDRSPLDVPAVRTKLRPGELVELVRQEREQSADRILSALGVKRPAPARVREATRKPRPRRPRK